MSENNNFDKRLVDLERTLDETILEVERLRRDLEFLEDVVRDLK